MQDFGAEKYDESKFNNFFINIVQRNVKGNSTRMFVHISGNTVIDGTLEVMIIPKTTLATDYVEHKENSVIFPLQEGQKMYLGSYLADDGTHHKRGQYVFTGNETITKNSISDTNSTLFYISSSIFKNLDINKADTSLCNYLIFQTLTNVQKTEGFRIHNTNVTYLNIKTEENTAQAVKAKLKEWYDNGTPMIIEYPLLESAEIIEPYTPEQQQAYNKLLKMHLQPIITAEALKSMKDLPRYSYDSTTQTLTITEV